MCDDDYDDFINQHLQDEKKTVSRKKVNQFQCINFSLHCIAFYVLLDTFISFYKLHLYVELNYFRPHQMSNINKNYF